MRGVLNSGFTRDSALVIRNVGDNHEPQPFKTWCPKVGALIGKLPDTLQDRAIVVTLRRRLTTERNERFSRRHHDEVLGLHRQAARWASDNLDALKDADPEMPRGLGDRAEDAWRPLLALADAAKGNWPAIARSAALALSGFTEEEADSASKGVLLLTHIREVFLAKGTDAIQSMQLLDALNANEEWPWGEWRQGKQITARGVASILKPYGIRPQQVSAGSFYRKAQFTDAWQRYLALPPASLSATSATDAEIDRNIIGLKATGATMRSATDQAAWQIENSRQLIEDTERVALVALGGRKQGNTTNGHSRQQDEVELF